MTSWLRRTARRLLGRHGRPQIPGPPEGLTLEELSAIGREQRGAEVVSASHSHLSAWKNSGSYRVYATDEAGSTWSTIFKRADYASDEIPALDGFPVRPGPPEFHVLSRAAGLAGLLPRVYLAREITAGVRFDYLLEDLSPTHRVAHPAEAVTCASFLPTLLAGLTSSFESADAKAALLDFGGGFWGELLIYAATSLDRFATRYPSSGARALIESLREIEQLRDQLLNEPDTAPAMTASRPIHGDYNLTNIMVGRQDQPPRVIDWEWAGLGTAHADLASLLKGLSGEVEDSAVRAFASRNRELSLRVHERVYRWSQIERGLTDASFLAAQALGTKRRGGLDLVTCVESSARLVSRYMEELQR